MPFVDYGEERVSLRVGGVEVFSESLAPGKGWLVWGLASWLAPLYAAAKGLEGWVLRVEGPPWRLSFGIAEDGEVRGPEPDDLDLNTLAVLWLLFKRLRTPVSFWDKKPWRSRLRSGAHALLAGREVKPKALGELLNGLEGVESWGLKLAAKGLRRVYSLSLRFPKLSPARLGDIWSFDPRVALGEEEISWEEFFEKVEEAKGLVKVGDSWVFLPLSRLRDLEALVEGPAALVRGLVEGEDLGFELGVPEAVKRDIAELLRPWTDVAVPEDVRGLEALKEYQRKGVAWALLRFQKGLGAIIADDVGLGKTYQGSALVKVALRREGGRALVVAPQNVLEKWEKVLRGSFGLGNVGLCHGSYWEPDAEVVLTTYDTLKNWVDDFKGPWTVAVMDEVQKAKNYDSQRHKALREVLPNAKFRLALSATPWENNLDELWAVMELVSPGFLGPRRAFSDYIGKPFLEGDAEAEAALLSLLSLVLLRRSYDDVKDEVEKTLLPPKRERVERLPLTEEQAALYEAILEMYAEAPLGLGEIFKLITELLKACSHPRLVSRKYPSAPALSGKLKRLLEIVLSSKDDDSFIVFFRFLSSLELVRETLEREGVKTLVMKGEMGKTERERVRRRFMEGEGKALLMTLGIAQGIDLTRANRVVHYEMWWNPAVMHQAEGRAHRTGQRREVEVVYLVSRGTVEERVFDLLSQKRGLLEATVNSVYRFIMRKSPEEVLGWLKLTR